MATGKDSVNSMSIALLPILSRAKGNQFMPGGGSSCTAWFRISGILIMSAGKTAKVCLKMLLTNI